MLRINKHTMELDLTVMGYIRMGRIACPQHGNVLQQSNNTYTIDPLYVAEARGHCCDTCGAPLVHAQVAVSA